eukprot:CAMPEP_0175145114 /NCGR_PEP_ID=MMETSP0087-20121206/14562_1 /TAXON_ID=136419 /ORGANISM="Unknown Unknown, Strain D1" /LENGTH=342 /DNA_ID=CAMNT_0016429767 /DNA_START=1 /DNA_END=1029 /DNA_ORIENTATION=+
MKSTYRGIQLKALSKEIAEGIDALTIENIERKACGPYDVRVAIQAGAVNYFDLLILVGRYQHKPKLPSVMGSEGSGVITEVGSKVKDWKVGDNVMIGMSPAGIMGEEVVLRSAYLLPKPKGFTHPQAAAFYVGYSTAYHGLVQRGKTVAGEWVLVTGAAGGMGAAAIQLAKKLGAKVIACASSQNKLDFCKKIGADHVINYSTEKLKERVMDITDGEGVDVVYEIVGGDIFKQSVRCMAGGGRLLVIGFASGTIPKLAANLALVKGFSLVGVRAGAEMARNPNLVKEMADDLRKWTNDGQTDLVPLVDHLYPLKDFKKAYRVLNERKVVGKACVSFASASKL